MCDALLNLLQLSMHIGEVVWRRSRSLGSRSGWTATKAKAKPDLPRASRIRDCSWLQWRVSLMNLLVKVVKEIAANSSETNSEWAELIHTRSGRSLSLTTWLARHSIATGYVLLRPARADTRCVVGIGACSCLGADDRASAGRAVLLPLQPAS